MATIYRIHPAIGIARVGNSPDEFFIGPERLFDYPSPPAGFKDAQCRIKRQAARFRIFAHHDDGSVAEVTDADAEIAWTVHLVNKKAANPGRGNSESAADLTIDPGPRTVSAPLRSAAFDDGQIKFAEAPAVVVPLGELRTDDQNRLLVLGGRGKSESPVGSGISSFWGNDDWYDDVSDGPVSAAITLRADGTSPAVLGAWVLVAPPKYAPHQDSIITLYDRVLQTLIDAGRVPAASSTSYTRDVYPILQRARDTRWVEQTFGAHGWSDPVTGDALRASIFARLRAPGGGGGDMPDLNESTTDGRLTAEQYAHMARWSSGNYVNDWIAPPGPEVDVTAHGLDRAALEACVGGAFYPGIEAGGLDATQRPLLEATRHLEPFRIDHATTSAGDFSYVMALPWQADFMACADDWWPVPRPVHVLPQGGAAPVRWDRDLASYQDMVDKWHSLGFVVRQGDEHVEVDRCGAASIQLLTPVLDFGDVPEGPLGMVREVPLAITFEVTAPSSALTLEYAPGGAPSHPQLFAYDTSVTVGPTAGSSIATARLWLIYKTSSPGDVLPTQTLTLRRAGGAEQWQVTVFATTVARKTMATALVLDRSGSMSEDRGDGQTKHDSLKDAAGIFVDLLLEGDGVGIVRFNEDAQVLNGVLPLGNGGLSDAHRNAVKDTLRGPGLDPAGQTSIGDGIFEGHGILSGASGFDARSLVVLTDGIENRARSIADVAALVDAKTYAVGLGRPQNISVPALQTLSGNNGGYLLVTGAIAADQRFLLQKHFVQILAGVNSAQVVLDPDGKLVPGRVERIPFLLTEADSGVDVILLTPNTKIVDFRLQTPNGSVLEPWRALREASMRYVAADGVTYFRIALPAQLLAGRFEGPGRWHVLLTIGHPRMEPSESSDGADRSIVRNMFTRAPTRRATRARTDPRQRALGARPAAVAPIGSAQGERRPRAVPYSLIVHAYSNLTFDAGLEQASHLPGTSIDLHASLLQSGLPVQPGANVWTEIDLPDGTTARVDLQELEAGRFALSYASRRAGLYRFRVRARGVTRSGEPFTRECTLTAAVYRTDDRVPGSEIGGVCCCRPPVTC